MISDTSTVFIKYRSTNEESPSEFKGKISFD